MEKKKSFILNNPQSHLIPQRRPTYTNGKSQQFWMWFGIRKPTQLKILVFYLSFLWVIITCKYSEGIYWLLLLVSMINRYRNLIARDYFGDVACVFTSKINKTLWWFKRSRYISRKLWEVWVWRSKKHSEQSPKVISLKFIISSVTIPL